MLTTPPPTVTIDAAAAERPPRERVDALRRRLDEVDATLLAILLARRELSTQIQSARIEAGGPRIQLSRESEILRRYQDALGRFGGDIGHAVLRLCRSGLPPRTAADATDDADDADDAATDADPGPS